MKNFLRTILYLNFVTFSHFYLCAQEITIQENETGFCSVDGAILTSVSGYTGDGYADTDRGVGKSVNWSVHAETAGSSFFIWRYGNGGGSGDRPARLLINGVVVIDTVNFPHTGLWTNWTETDSIAIDLYEGNNWIRLEAYSADGLGNIDYMRVVGSGISPAECIPVYTLIVNQNDEAGGSISYEPVQDYYEAGTSITLRSEANDGYFFQSWSGDATSADSVFTFAISKNTVATALFYPEGTTMDPDIIGYATVQDDEGTPYLVTGGSMGDTVEATSFQELQQYLGSSEPYVVTVSGRIQGTQSLKVSSHKTILGVTDSAHLQGIEVEINEARNVIVQHMKISHVTPTDAIVITGKSRNIWIDHCELYSDRDHDVDYYDGLLDIKNESSFITVSWSVFHDHYKTSLISSGDQQFADTTIRVTYHHNYFYNCSSRLPSIRFGKAHVFNNYYKDCGTAINSRMGACVRVERNYFHNVNTAVMMAYSPEMGAVQLLDNHFGTSGVSSSPACELDVPYPYLEFLDQTEDLSLLIGGEDITEISEKIPVVRPCDIYNYPNPFNSSTKIHFILKKSSHVTLKIFDILGREVTTLINKKCNAGKYTILWNGAVYAGGIYFYRLQADGFAEIKKMVFLK